MFDPEITEGDWPIEPTEGVGSNGEKEYLKIGPIDHQDIYLYAKPEDAKAIVAVPQLLKVLRLARVACNMSLGLHELEDSIKELDKRHCKYGFSEKDLPY